jgi:hypothetical protein
LHSRYREQICRRRDYLKEFAPRPKWELLPDGRSARAVAAPAKAVVAAKGLVGSRVAILLGLGETTDDASLYALSIPEARHLVQMVQGALDAAPPKSPY